METLLLLLLAIVFVGVFIIGGIVLICVGAIGITVFTRVGRAALVGAITNKIVNAIFGSKVVRFRKKA